jgi:hypothetical protein
VSRFDRTVSLVQSLLRLPFFQSLPGSALEEILAHVTGGERMGTYDFVDVVAKREKIGYQVKSIRATTPVTWKRAKLPDKNTFIEASHRDAKGAQALGDAIIAFCNDHAIQSIKKYGLQRLVYARLVDYMDDTLTYFEKDLPINKPLFNPRDFTWSWSKAKEATTKEQLSAFHGVDKATGRSWFAWHGLGENQLHFKGESAWWPPAGSPDRVDFRRAEGGALALVDIAEAILACVPADRSTRR